MKKLVTIILSVCMCVCCGVLLSACGDDSAHTHAYSAEWSSDGAYHWHACEDSACSSVSGKARHSFSGGICSVCGMTKPVESPAYTLNDDGTEYSVTGIGTCTGTDIVIPDVYNGKPVTAIGKGAFEDCCDLTTVELPSSLTRIGDDAFRSCSGLITVTIPSGVTSIGTYAFYGCDKLAEVVNNSDVVVKKGDSAGGYAGYDALVVHSGNSQAVNADGYRFIAADGVNYLLAYTGSDTELVLPDKYNNENYEIYKYAFRGDELITKVTTGAGVTAVGDKSFYNCTALTSIELNSGITSVGEFAFYGCDNLQYNVTGNACYLGSSENKYLCLIKAESSDITTCTISENCKFVYDAAFDCCGSLENMIIPSGVTGIGNYAFNYCTGLKSINIGKNVEKIGKSAFEGCGKLESIVIPDKVTRIEKDSFRYCRGLKTVNFSSGVTTVGEYAFYGCDGVQSVLIPSSVTSIGSYAFDGCSKLDTVYYTGTASQWNKIAIGNPNTRLPNRKDGAALYCYSATQPTGEGNYWHYDTDGKTILVW